LSQLGQVVQQVIGFCIFGLLASGCEVMTMTDEY